MISPEMSAAETHNLVKSLRWREEQNSFLSALNEQGLADIREYEEPLVCHACGKYYPAEFGGTLCPRCEDLQLEAMEIITEQRR